MKIDDFAGRNIVLCLFVFEKTFGSIKYNILLHTLILFIFVLFVDLSICILIFEIKQFRLNLQWKNNMYTVDIMNTVFSYYLQYIWFVRAITYHYV